MSRSRVLLVGESNPYGTEPGFALYPLPRGASGDRLREILALSTSSYLKTFDRRNLLEAGPWSATRARDEAGKITHRRRVLLGARVAAAHGIREWVPFRTHVITTPTVPFCHLLTLPHPSGRSRAWNDPDAPLLARAAMRRFFLECGLEPRPEWGGA